MDNTRPIFTYDELVLSNEEPSFRLIELAPGLLGDGIVCEIRNVPFSRGPSYEALSYTWSSKGKVWIPDTPTPIICNGAHVEITLSLETALRHLRQPTGIRIIWADAICINQKDDDEKTEQVQLMQEIYRNASQVLIWLGPERPGGGDAMDLIPHLARKFRHHFSTVKDFHESVDLRFMGLLARKAMDIDPDEVLEGGYRKNRGAFLAYYELLTLPWFTRTWIIQEAALASQATIFHGAKSVSWADFVVAYIFCTTNAGLMMFHSLDGLEHAAGLLNAYEAFQTSGQGLLDLLLQHRTNGVTDPRDKIFALCGLANDTGPNQLNITPDYRLTSLETYTSTTIAMLKHTDGVDILSVPHSDSPSNIVGLPSWVPDWSATARSTSFRAHGHAREDIFPSNRNRTERLTFQFSADNKLLGFSGFVFDHVLKVGALHDISGSSGLLTKVPAEQTILNNWEHVSGARSWSKYINGEKMIDVYWQTLVGGCLPEQYDNFQKQFYDLDRNAKRFRVLHWTGVHNVEKAYYWASIGALCVSALSDAARGSMASPLTGGDATLEFTAKMKLAVTGRRMFKTAKGYVGLGAGAIQPGDTVTFIQGAVTTLILRKMDSRLYHVGDAYVHGVPNEGDHLRQENQETLWIS